MIRFEGKTCHCKINWSYLYHFWRWKEKENGWKDVLSPMKYIFFQNSQNFCLTWPLEHWFSIEYIGYKCRFRDRSILCSFFVDKRYISNNSWLPANSVSHNGLHCDTNAIRQPSPYMWPCNNVTMLRCSNTITNICIGPTSTPTWLMIVVVCTGWTSYDW